jgi:hypothetical protein
MPNELYMPTVLKRHSKGILLQAKGDCSNQVHSDQMVLGKARQEAGTQKRQLKVLKTKLTQGEASGSSPLRSDGSHNGQMGVWTSGEETKDTQGRVEKQL